MTTIINDLRTLKYTGLRQPLVRGSLPNVKLTDDPPNWIGGWVFLFTAICVFICYVTALLWNKSLDFFIAVERAISPSIISGLAVALFYYLLPILFVLGFTIKYRQRPSRNNVLTLFSGGQIFFCMAVATFTVVYFLNHVYPGIESYLHTKKLPTHWFNQKGYITDTWHISVIVLGLTPIFAILIFFLFPKELKTRKTRIKCPKKVAKGLHLNNLPFGFWLGCSTGHLTSLWHKTGIAPNINIVLNTEDATQNIIVLGGIGSGKTTCLIQPLIAQLFDQTCGGLLFDVKGDLKKSVIQLSKATNHSVIFVGPNHNQMNLLAGLPPEVAASFLKSALLLCTDVSRDRIWLDAATELCRNTLGVLSFSPSHYTLQGLYNYLFNKEIKETIQAELSALLRTLNGQERHLLKTYLGYHDSIFSTFSDLVQSTVNATIAQILSPFNHQKLINAFCEPSQVSLNMDLVTDGAVYLVDMPLASWGLGGKVAYTLIKLRFFNAMQNRVLHENGSQDHPVFFMCEEYQELISANKDALSDLNFWNKSKSYKTIGIVSLQSVSSLYTALGDQDLAHSIIQNFRQKICFKTEDDATLTMMSKLAGRAKLLRKTIGQITGETSGDFSNTSLTHHSRSQSITETYESVLDTTIFRNLTANQAVVFLSLSGLSYDDILECLPALL